MNSWSDHRLTRGPCHSLAVWERLGTEKMMAAGLVLLLVHSECALTSRCS